jgi:hypothetical protein
MTFLFLFYFIPYLPSRLTERNRSVHNFTGPRPERPFLAQLAQPIAPFINADKPIHIADIGVTRRRP